MGEDRSLDFAQRLARLDAELLAQMLGAPGNAAQRLGLTPTAVQRRRQLDRQTFAKRVGGSR